ncbi:MAG: NADH-quinone oxidoreductase subunit M [Caldimonas sp.]
MSDAVILELVLFLPLIGVGVLLATPAGSHDLTRRLTLAVMAVQLALAAWLYVRFDSTVAGLQFETRLPWIAAWGVYYQIGLDGYNILLVLLTAFLGPLVVAGAFSAITKDVKLFYAMVFLVQFAMMGTFVAQDLFVFYLFWETMLIPMFLLIGIWGGERRIYATIKFVLYTAFGSILMLAAVIYLVYSLQATTGVTSFAFADLVKTRLPLEAQSWLLAAFALSFAIKVPMVPLHTWLPDAHVEAPTTGSVILAGVMLKMGTYGFMKLGFPLFPDATHLYTPLLMTLAVISIVYGALMAIGSNNIPRLIGYTSVSHFGFIVLGIFVMNSQGLSGANLYMFNHGLSTAALFLVTGFLISRRGSALISDFGGVEKVAPVLAGVFLVAGLSSLSLPGLSPFVSEFLVIVGAFSHSVVAASFAVTGIVLAAIYILLMYQRTMTGPTRVEVVGMRDLGTREVAALAPVLILIVIFGFFPKPLLDVINPSVDHTMSQVDRHDPAPTVAEQTPEGAHE